MEPDEKTPGEKIGEEQKEEKSLFGVIIHSFFIIPFLIAVFCVLLFAAIMMLTREQATVYDYLEDVKTGGLTKRWQAAFELSKILANPQLIPDDERFSAELINAFEHAQHDDNRVRQYLALAMGRTGDLRYFEPLTRDIKTEKSNNLYAIIYAIGMLKDKKGVPVLSNYLDHPDARIRSVAVVALGSIADKSTKYLLKKTLTDPEPNVKWGSAISLAQMGDPSGKVIIHQLLQRDYLSKFSEVDETEKRHLILAAIEASSHLQEQDLNKKIQALADQDQNMKIRSAAKEYIANLNKN